jgi:hypothetical protein
VKISHLLQALPQQHFSHPICSVYGSAFNEVQVFLVQHYVIA